jgi:hypothetical protein
MKKKALIILVSVAAIPLALALLSLGFLFWAHDFNPHFLDIDTCLDLGGRWDYGKNVCATFSTKENNGVSNLAYLVNSQGLTPQMRLLNNRSVRSYKRVIDLEE